MSADVEETRRLTIQGHIDEVLLRKEPLYDLSDIFHYQSKPCPRIILIIGGPGESAILFYIRTLSACHAYFNL